MASQQGSNKKLYSPAVVLVHVDYYPYGKHKNTHCEACWLFICSIYNPISSLTFQNNQFGGVAFGSTKPQ